MTYRYYPKDSQEHYTAVVKKDKTILQVKPTILPFASLEAWLVTLPNQPTEQDLQVQAEKVKWNIPRRPYNRAGVSWKYYLYRMIINSRTKSKDALKEAYDNFVSTLDQFKDTYRVLIPYYSVSRRYDFVILRNTPEECNQLPIELYKANYNDGKITYWSRVYSLNLCKEFSVPVYTAYKALYDLMEQHGVLEFVRSKLIKKHNVFIRKQMGRIESNIWRLQRKKEIYEHNVQLEMKRLEELKQKLNKL